VGPWVLALVLVAGGAEASAEERYALVVSGATGGQEYAAQYTAWTDTLSRLFSGKYKFDPAAVMVLTDADAPEKAATADNVRKVVNGVRQKMTRDDLFIIVLIGHGTFDGKEGKFNLLGPDISMTELADWLKPFRRPVAIINCASSSGAFLAKLSATNRVVITATRSGHEQNFARFGAYLSKAIGDPQADLDKDGQTSLLEAYLIASRELAEFYKSEGRLATEHPLLDDNGDGLGTPADWFRGIRATKRARDGAALDGFRAHQFHLVRSDTEQKMAPEVRARRDSLELQIARLRENKSGLPEEEYYRLLEPLLLELAKAYQQR